MSLTSPTTDPSTPLFDPAFISPEVLSQLPEGYSCRPLQRNDYNNGFLDVLRVLTVVGDVTDEVRCGGLRCHSITSTRKYP
jgi:glucosamine-phosphate N-acetyltransferase